MIFVFIVIALGCLLLSGGFVGVCLGCDCVWYSGFVYLFELLFDWFRFGCGFRWFGRIGLIYWFRGLEPV